MAYQSLYRKFRSKNFDELIGQEHVTTTLKNQITNDSIAHAYLFCGTRGTGKTSAAKIFARAVNCLNNTDGNPCNECEVCKGILDDSIMDVVEMDAASNNSVEDIRDLREKAKYPPAKGRFKVYIVDEVHMLSKGAFNALLKTLEEPPKHLLFILATTEPQKLPTTIQSRCQRYDFRRISVKDMLKHMQDICEQLKIKVDERGLYLIARNADGAMRDALSLLDQCISFAESEITYEDIISTLGTVNNTIIFDIANGIINLDVNKSLRIVDDIVQSGKDINQFIKDLIVHFRNLMIIKSTDDIDSIIEGSKEFIEELKEQSSSTTLASILRCIKILSEAENQSKWSSQPRIVLEITIIKLCNKATGLSLEELSSRVEELEEMIRSGKISTGNNESNKRKVSVKNKEDNNYNKKSNIPSSNGNSLDNKTEIERNNVNVKETNMISESGADNLKSTAKITTEKAVKEWPEVLRDIKKERISIHALLMEGKPVEVRGNTFIISFNEGFGFHRDAVDKKQNKEYVQEKLNKFFNSGLEVKFIMDSDIVDIKQDEKKTDKVVEKVKEVFGEDLVEVE
ncbi:DNA polymerase III subunit gamma/tau [Sporosalibacterium faouarense]|uniref:DNA polymerase III subunit gamma/tau n=1 Tax=Sporosalibacterium faouarense TaxID=516123 RepID=UPI00141C4F03|nr:DNA polymerase III subunit gamma/tau [Sporosalibacterium faouarense]MTI48786.1 DNA polymerase III subunit gamma/tau [Bacillota bacterium]